MQAEIPFSRSSPPVDDHRLGGTNNKYLWKVWEDIMEGLDDR